MALDPTQIADLQENDTTAHIEDFSHILPPGTLAILIVPQRISGTGNFQIFPRSHGTKNWVATIDSFSLVTVKNRELKWKNTVANDDWDIYLLGYFVQKRTR